MCGASLVNKEAVWRENQKLKSCILLKVLCWFLNPSLKFTYISTIRQLIDLIVIWIVCIVFFLICSVESLNTRWLNSTSKNYVFSVIPGIKVSFNPMSPFTSTIYDVLWTALFLRFLWTFFFCMSLQTHRIYFNLTNELFCCPSEGNFPVIMNSFLNRRLCRIVKNNSDKNKSTRPKAIKSWMR